MNEVIQAVLDELSHAGIKGCVEQGRKHFSVLWLAPNGQEQRTICASTPSDVRAVVNQRALIRRQMCDLGVGQDPEPQDTGGAILAIREGRATCTSLDIASKFQKAHKDVLRAIDRVRADIGVEFDQRNFAPISYLDGKGRSYRAFSLTRDGFVMVAMGFTGPDAARWKARYIDAFNAMETELARLVTPIAELDPRVGALRGDLDALTEIVLSLPAPRAARKGPWVNPAHIFRRRREERRARA